MPQRSWHKPGQGAPSDGVPALLLGISHACALPVPISLASAVAESACNHPSFA